MDTQKNIELEDLSLDKASPSHILYLINTKKIAIDEVSDDNIRRIFNSFRTNTVEERCNMEALVSRAVGISGSFLRNASENLQDNKDIVLKAVQNDGWAITYASPNLRKDVDVVIAAVSNNGFVLSVLEPEQKDNKEIVLAAVTEKGASLQYAGPNCIKDKDITLVAVNRLCPLEYIDDMYYDDEDIMLAAVKAYKEFAIKYLSPRLRDNPEFMEGIQPYITSDFSKVSENINVTSSSPISIMDNTPSIDKDTSLEVPVANSTTQQIIEDDTTIKQNLDADLKEENIVEDSSDKHKYQFGLISKVKSLLNRIKQWYSNKQPKALEGPVEESHSPENYNSMLLEVCSDDEFRDYIKTEKKVTREVQHISEKEEQ